MKKYLTEQTPEDSAQKKKPAKADSYGLYPYRNKEGYADPTAHQAVLRVEAEDARLKTLIHVVRHVCSLAGFEIEGRITLVDKETGKVYR